MAVFKIGTSTAFNDGLWHQLTAQVSSAGMKLFIDGILSASNAGYTTPEITMDTGVSVMTT